ncbi:MAG: IspD/TarI family cytidylyltransferase [Gemmatimonadota bacterium]
MGGEGKQFRLLDGRPAMCWAARPLVEALAGPLVVVLPADRLAEGEDLLHAHLSPASARLRVTAGGARRQDSVRAGLEAVPETETLLVHDAARPFASAGLCERVARRAVAGRSVIPAVPIQDTLKEIEGDRVVRTHDRRRFVAAQTPQGFPRSVLRQAHEEATPPDATDDAELCERLGIPVTWIPGEILNRKLTDPDDWTWAERAIAEGRVRW